MTVLFALGVFAERKSPNKYFLYFIFDNKFGIQTQVLTSNKNTTY